MRVDAQRYLPYATLLFGVFSVLVAIIGLIWHGSDVYQTLHLHAPLAWMLTIVHVAAGIAILYPPASRAGAIVLGAIYLTFSLAAVPGMVAAPLDPGSYVNFFEQFSLVCGAIALYASTLPDAAQSLTQARLARLLLGVCVVSFAWAQVVYFQYTASLVPTWIPPSQAFWTILTTIAFALAGIALLVNVQARLATRLMVVMIALFGVLVWIPRIVGAPHALNNYNEITSNYLMAGAAWIVAELKAF